MNLDIERSPEDLIDDLLAVLGASNEVKKYTKFGFCRLTRIRDSWYALYLTLDPETAVKMGFEEGVIRIEYLAKLNGSHTLTQKATINNKDSIEEIEIPAELSLDNLLVELT